jgi:hypothetical protein
VLERLDGFEAPASSWERSILPARLEGYDPALLDMACLSGDVRWAACRPRRAAHDVGHAGGAAGQRAAPTPGYVEAVFRPPCRRAAADASR